MEKQAILKDFDIVYVHHALEFYCQNYASNEPYKEIKDKLAKIIFED